MPPPAATTAPFPLADASKDTQPSSETLGARIVLEFRKSQTWERYVLHSIIWGPSLGELGGTPCKQVFSCLRRKHLTPPRRGAQKDHKTPRIWAGQASPPEDIARNLMSKAFVSSELCRLEAAERGMEDGVGSGREAAIFKPWAQLILP